MLELKKNKHNTYYHCTYLYIDNAVIVKMLTSQLKPDLANKTKTILHNPLVQYSRGLNWFGNIDELAVLARGGAILKCCHNALGQLTNHNTFSFSEGGPSSNPELIEPFVSGWGEIYCNHVNYVKNNTMFEPPCMKACSGTPLNKIKTL